MAFRETSASAFTMAYLCEKLNFPQTIQSFVYFRVRRFPQRDGWDWSICGTGEVRGDCADGGSAQPWAGPGYKCSAVPCPRVTVRATTLRSTAITVLSVTCPPTLCCLHALQPSCNCQAWYVWVLFWVPEGPSVLLHGEPLGAAISR